MLIFSFFKKYLKIDSNSAFLLKFAVFVILIITYDVVIRNRYWLHLWQPTFLLVVLFSIYFVLTSFAWIQQKARTR